MMDIGVYSASNISNQEISNLILQKKTFTIKDIPNSNFGNTVETIEKLIEAQNLSCRVYVAGRIAAFGAATAWSMFGGLAAGLAIAAHTIATYNPDYEIAKYFVTKKLIVTYMKN
ncbi:hypothetical protein QDY63_26100 [Pseudomonas brenneri]|uniref:hypothetical protein n=1 Tax=Pseudomonas brenneri TaxID=129817 RepID=UPI0025A2D1C2|nr:hypothetical protein [Pseudomonas brenneri]WJM90785.1 hypothetical protein QDY63_26100 [Pseudomonas brenneri]